MNFVKKHPGLVGLSVFFVSTLALVTSQNGNQPVGEEVDTGQTLSGQLQQNLDELIDRVEEDELRQNENATSSDSSRPTVALPVTGAYASQMQQNLMKNSGTGLPTSQVYDTLATYAPEIIEEYTQHQDVSGESRPGDVYRVAVHSLRLNNKYFNKTLAYMLRGDTIEQLQAENSYGCFEGKIISSRNEHNIGKVGYVCKKYLHIEYQVDQEKQENVASIDTVELKIPQTKVGDIIGVEQSVELENGIILSPGDSIEQLSEIDENACFMAHMIETKIEMSVVPTSRVCYSQILQ